jgi:aminopeptidase YwaD
MPVVAACSLTPVPDVEARLRRVDEQRLRAHVEALCAIGPRPAGDARATETTLAYLERELRAQGYATRREPFTALAMDWRRSTDERGQVTFVATGRVGPRENLIAETRNAPEGARVIEVGAHFDTVVFGPGADDNASGVAAALEVARLVQDVPTTKTIRFVFFAMEEEQLVGSREHIERMQRDGELPEGLLSLDMIGYRSHAQDSQRSPVHVPLLLSPPDVGDFILVAGNHGSGWLGNLFESCIDAYVPSLTYYSLNRLAAWFDDASRGDHWNYWQAGIPAIAIGDTAEYRNPHYHKATDAPSTLDYAFLRDNTRAVLATALHWAELR